MSRLAETLAQNLGIVPFRPGHDIAAQATVQPLFIYGSQAWFDNEYVNRKFASWQFVNRSNDGLVLLERKAAWHPEDHEPEMIMLALTAEKARASVELMDAVLSGRDA